MFARIIESYCGKLVYFSNTLPKNCPFCGEHIRYDVENDAWLGEKGGVTRQLLPGYKFYPSRLRYFRNEFPEPGKQILIIKNDYTAQFWRWKAQDVNLLHANPSFLFAWIYTE